MNFKPIRIAHGAPAKKSARQGRASRRATDRSEPSSRSQPLASPDGRFDGTVVYTHGIANKPAASVLKCQWDRALFGTGMGQRTRMVYWVNRDRYPDPDPATCNDRDFSEGAELVGEDDPVLRDEQRSMRMHLAEEQASRLLSGSSAPTSQKKKWEAQLKGIAERLESNAAQGHERLGDVHAEVLPLPRWARDRLTRTFTKLLLNDVYDYFYDARNARHIDAIFKSRLGDGPLVVIGHSFGSVIAYLNLCRSDALEPGIVRLFVTIGSPLGLQEVQDNLMEKLDVDRLAVPDCVGHWVNIADWLDPVAADPRLNNDIEGTIEDIRATNLDSPRHPHSATGYLGLSACQERVREAVGAAFAQPISSFSIARDLTDRIEDSLTLIGEEELPANRGEKHHVLIELSKRGDEDLETAKGRLIEKMTEALGAAIFKTLKVVELRRYLAVDLTSLQIERLGPILQREHAGRIWSDSEKMTLTKTMIAPREDPVQSSAAARVYGTDGGGIHWAVLDTGVEPNHPHFRTHQSIEAAWDCTHDEPSIDSESADPLDRHGHGTHVAGIIAGSVMAASGDAKARHGVAPMAKLHSYKVLGASGRGRDSHIIRALDHIAAVNESSSSIVIHGVNLSLGGPFDPETYGCGHSPICSELRRLWRQGVLVVVAAGNAGFAELQSSRGALRANLDLSIGDPANLEEAIAVGSVHLANPLTYGTSFFSSRGPTADGRQKPDLVAPGERIRSANYAYRSSDDYIELSGTSMAAPHVSGLLAAFMSQRRELIGEPDRVKSLLLGSCTDLKRDPYVQGAGLPNLVRMLLAT